MDPPKRLWIFSSIPVIIKAIAAALTIRKDTKITIKVDKRKYNPSLLATSYNHFFFLK